MNAFTAGPWSVQHTPSRDLEGEEARIAEAQECEPWAYAITRIPETGFEKVYDDRNANRALADAFMHAAAPELFETLEEAGRQLAVQREWIKHWSPNFESEGEYVGDAELADAAIDKALTALSRALGRENGSGQATAAEGSDL
ncbi:MAG TPA: hypothetical protein VM915_17290 [Verrucomicrobiae bacterium]|nr:hypothetical protein [Verrucomicrobiae bacterium]